jgi:lysophospholipase L1-like esterase
LYVLNKRYGHKKPYPWNKSRISILGDSRVSEVDWLSGLGRRDIVNHAISGISVDALSRKMDSILNLDSPEIAIIQIGINDIREGTSIESVKIDYKVVIEKLTKIGVKPIVTSTIPLRKDFWQDDISEIIVNQ